MQRTIACWPKRLAVTAPGCTGEPLSLARHLRRLLCGSTGSGRSTAASALARAARPSAQAAQAGGRHRSSAWRRTCTRLQTAASLAATVTHLRAREPARTPVQGHAERKNQIELQVELQQRGGTRVGFSRATCARHQHCQRWRDSACGQLHTSVARAAPQRRTTGRSGRPGAGGTPRAARAPGSCPPSPACHSGCLLCTTPAPAPRRRRRSLLSVCRRCAAVAA
jgi:energy-coupling factor transporter ATP-binding protein EcfA2